MLTPTPHQQAILDDIKDFLSSEDSVFILKGYAGTGKTTMIKMIVGLFPENERALFH